MGKIYQFGNVRIVIYANDHLPAHFHILAPGAEALVGISPLRILKGSVPAKVERTAMTWATANVAMLKAEWNRINARFPVA
ncbi:DUF4160 domain-containing protein [uncultured Methylobacterium sp.]|uniref:DUF4160 domain-containing protein n=1 Tax=uncultured Methylobacterium sp. TaxID=157278 RepID=UPI0035CBD951